MQTIIETHQVDMILPGNVYFDGGPAGWALEQALVATGDGVVEPVLEEANPM